MSEKEKNSENHIDTPAESELPVSTKRKRKTKLQQAQHALKYGIASLSLVSFFTTSRGLEEIVSSKYTITPYLISFGIQVIVLVVGTRLANILKTIDTLDVKKRLRGFIAVSVVVPYITSVGFSSFFSYTFLANQAYERVRETDYNIKIEHFMNEEIVNLDSLNDAAGKVILAQVQSYIPQIDGILQQFQTIASDEITHIKDTLVKNPNSDITEKITFRADADAYSNASDAQKERLRAAESALQTAVGTYAVCYANYSAVYDMLINSENLDNLKATVDATQNNIQNNIQSIRKQQEIINTLQDPTYNTQIKSSVASISASFESLITSYEALSHAYNLIDTNETVNSGTIDLQNIYNTIYSTTDVTDEDVAQSIQDLQSIISAFLKQPNLDNSANDSLQKLSTCITYLGEFQKYKDLSNKLDAFEANVLTKVYVIEYPSTTANTMAETESTDAETTESESTTVPVTETEIPTEPGTDTATSRSNFAVNHVKQDEWNEIRREHLGEFINMVKSLPNFETIINSSSNVSSETRQYIRLLRKNTSYRTETLEEAYKLNRQNLEEISSIEKARNYLHSDFRYMAFYCLFVAVFLDLSSLFVGLFIFFTDKKGKNTDSPDSSVQTVNTTDTP